MSKLDFGDVYKFVVSLGVTLVALGVLIPWLILREAVASVRTVEEIQKLSAGGRELLAQREVILAWLLGHVEWLSWPLLAGGLVICVEGLRRWNGNQSLLDAQKLAETKKFWAEEHKARAEGDKVRAELEKITAESKDVALKREAVETIVPEIDEVPAVLLQSGVAKYQEIERTLNELLRRGAPNNSTLLSNRRIGPTDFDSILQLAGNEPDIILEYKYRSRSISVRDVSRILDETRSRVYLYEQTTGRAARGVVVFVVPAELLNMAESLESRVASSIQESTPVVKLMLLKEEDLGVIQPSTMFDLISNA